MYAPNDWLVNLAPQRRGRINLLCLPFAGGGSSAYHEWPSGLAPEVNVWAARLPGRESRLLEPPYLDLDALVRALVPATAALTDRPYLVFGHSMGALLGYELLRLFRGQGLPAPECLIVSGSRAPHQPDTGPPLHTLPDHRMIAALREYGATPEPLLDQPELLELFLPTIRADFQVAETYRHRSGPPLSCPITVLRGESDPDVSRDQCLAWHELTTGQCTQHCFPGGHFFVDSARTQVLTTITGLLTGYAAA